MMRVLPYSPLQSSYAVTPDDGVRAIKLDGGASRVSIVSVGNVALVDVSWALEGNAFDIMSGFYRVWRRTLEPFLARLLIDSSELDVYEASFVPNSWRIVEKIGRLVMVSAQLEVIPLDKFEDEITDPGQALLLLYAEYGRTGASVFLNRLEKLVNEDLPHEQR